MWTCSHTEALKIMLIQYYGVASKNKEHPRGKSESGGRKYGSFLQALNGKDLPHTCCCLFRWPLGVANSHSVLQELQPSCQEFICTFLLTSWTLHNCHQDRKCQVCCRVFPAAWRCRIGERGFLSSFSGVPSFIGAIAFLHNWNKFVQILCDCWQGS